MAQKLSALEEKVLGIKKIKEFRKFNITAQVGETRNNIDAYVNIDNWEINITVDPKIEDTLKIIPKELVDSEDLLDDLLYTAVQHEIGHNKSPEGFLGCAGDEVYFKKIAQGINDALEELKVPKEQRSQLIPMYSNYFADFIDNVGNALKLENKDKFRNGVLTFYGMGAIACKKMNKLLPKAFGTIIDMQVKSFSSDEFQREFFEKLIKDYDTKYARDLFNIFTQDQKLTDKILNNEMNASLGHDLYNELMDKDKWNLKAYEFTKKIHEISKNDQNNQNSQNKNQQGNKSGESSGSSEGSDGMTGEFEPKDDNFTKKYKENKVFRDKINGEVQEENKPKKPQPQGQSKDKEQPESKMKVKKIKIGFKDKNNPLDAFFGNKGKGNYEVPDELLEQYRNQANGEDLALLYQLYESLAGSLPMFRSKQGNHDSNEFPIGYLQSRRISRPGEVSIDDIDWERSMPLPNNEWSFSAKDHPITVEEENSESHGSAKDVCFIGDVSGSMGYAAPLILHGGNINLSNLQGHDKFCVMVHSVIKGLKEKNMAYHLKYSSMLFSDHTEFSGWYTYYEIDEMFKFIYTGYEGEGTTLNPQKFKSIYDSSSDKFLAIMLTDSGISNHEQCGKTVGEIIDNGNDFVLVEYQPVVYGEGKLSSFGEFIKSKGADVHVITEMNDLFKIAHSKVEGMY